jgi:FkbM family methyltransferase
MIVSKIIRRLKGRWRKLTNAKTVTLDDVILDTTQGNLPKLVRSLLFKESYEEAERILISDVLKTGMRVVEIGTGIGLISILANRLCGRGNVMSYEANPFLEPIIRRNFDLNGLSPNLIMRAVTADGSKVSFFRSENIVSSSLYDRKLTKEMISVESEAFPDILARHTPDVIIMDIEGAEVDLLGSFDPGGVRDMIVELHPHIVGQARIDALERNLAAAGFLARRRIDNTVHFQRHG